MRREWRWKGGILRNIRKMMLTFTNKIVETLAFHMHEETMAGENEGE